MPFLGLGCVSLDSHSHLSHLMVPLLQCPVPGLVLVDHLEISTCSTECSGVESYGHILDYPLCTSVSQDVLIASFLTGAIEGAAYHLSYMA